MVSKVNEPAQSELAVRTDQVNKQTTSADAAGSTPGASTTTKRAPVIEKPQTPVARSVPTAQSTTDAWDCDGWDDSDDALDALTVPPCKPPPAASKKLIRPPVVANSTKPVKVKVVASSDAPLKAKKLPKKGMPIKAKEDSSANDDAWAGDDDGWGDDPW